MESGRRGTAELYRKISQGLRKCWRSTVEDACVSKDQFLTKYLCICLRSYVRRLIFFSASSKQGRFNFSIIFNSPMREFLWALARSENTFLQFGLAKCVRICKSKGHSELETGTSISEFCADKRGRGNERRCLFVSPCCLRRYPRRSWHVEATGPWQSGLTSRRLPRTRWSGNCASLLRPVSMDRPRMYHFL